MMRNPYRMRGNWVSAVRGLLFVASLCLAAFEVYIVFTEAESAWSLLRRAAAVGSMALVLLLHKPIRQVLDVLIEGKPVRLELWFSSVKRARLRWSANGESATLVLGDKAHGLTWFDPVITPHGVRRRLLICYDQRTFIVTNGNEPYAFAIQENRMQ